MLFEVNHRDFFFASTPSNLLLHVHIFHFIRMNLVFLQISSSTLVFGIQR